MVTFPQLSPLHEERLAAIDEKASAWRRLFPLSDDMALAQRSFDEDFLVRMAYNSNAIEGSTLTLAETEVVYEGEFVPGRPGREQVAARGIFEGAGFLEERRLAGAAFDETLLLDLHERCALDLQPRARGAYRNAPAIIVAARTTPVAPLRIRAAMGDLFFHYERLHRESHPLVAVAWFHAAFEAIHPFADGNGRAGRLWMNAQLQALGYAPVSIKVDHSLEYKGGLEAWQVDEDPTAFLELFLGCVEEELDRRIAFLGQVPRPQDPRLAAVPHGSEALGALANNPAASASALGKQLGLSARQAQRVLQGLREAGFIEHVGPNRGGRWVLRP